ncbi:hypothetical protein [Deinococcus soli (ex Cha et al. 2016)]|uniref:hypothetical protein n=1 Tax=Deinococcus soli (ex Cha et al. 2016) TaxID=1309411 RepID=UPI001669741A|nr:hypothetical protein [Deinococcus soli (ex Cha et al. 2016)]GGB73823.1 hypothetical protein GCM10008019_32520 [Deinococcus soli (ex Cha et al. 2016)]
MKRTAVFLSLVLSLTAAQAQGTVRGPGGYEYTPGLTPEQQAQLRAKLEERLALPKVIGRTAKAAVTAILNEPTLISGMVGPLPRELAEALNRAAIRTPVRLVMATQSTRNVIAMPRVQTLLVNAASPVTMLATKDLLITVDGQGVTVYQTALQAGQVHQNVQQLIDALAKANRK